MWGCLRALVLTILAFFAVLFLIIGSGYWYLGTSSFRQLIRLRIEKTLEARMGRDVTIRDVQIVRSRPQKVIINDLRVANAPGALNPYFATVRQIEITGGIDSFWGRRIKVGRVEIRDPCIDFEVFPRGFPLVHNFPHWQPPKRGKYEIYHLDLGTLFVTGGAFSLFDRRHNISAVVSNIASQVNVTTAEDLYEGVATSPLARVRLQDYVPFNLDLSGRFRYTPGILELKLVALRGRGMETFLSGRLQPLTEGVYDLHVTSQIGLDRVREIFKIQRPLEGTLSLDGALKGQEGNFMLTGRWSSPRVVADVYQLAALRGRMNVTDERSIIDIDTARYGGGTITAHYTLPRYDEPYPMSIDLRYDQVSLEKLMGDWGIENTGLRGAATGRLAYQWKKDKILDGSGSGTATLTKNSIARSNAKYPIPLAGEMDFLLSRGVVTFRRADLNTDASRVAFTGIFRIDDAYTEVDIRIRSSDFSDLDRLGYNFAQSAGKKTYTLLGLGGAGDIAGTVKGRIREPAVVAHISGGDAKFNNILLGEADIDLRYDGVKSILTFDRAAFRDGGARLAMTGTLGFPDRGPSPTFDLAIDAASYPVDRTMNIVTLPFKGVRGLGTGRLIVTGSPDAGRATFAGLTIRQADAELRLRGDVQWAPGKGNVRFDLDLAARSYPVANVVTFLDLGELPVTGELTGTLHIEGPKNRLEGAGAITVRRGSISGEPVDLATADIVFTQGLLRATNVAVTSPAGQISGEAEVNLESERFSYMIRSSTIDLSKLKIASELAGLLGGKVTITSSGAGTFEQPELVLEATLSETTLSGMALPPGTPPPTLYVAIHNGQLVVRGSAAGALKIEGDGTVGQDMTIEGGVRITVTDLAKLVTLFPATASLPASGNFVVDLRLGGKLVPIEALRIDGTMPVLDVRLSGHEFTAPQPLRFGLRNGRMTLDQFELRREGSSFAVSGYAEVTGDKTLDLSVRGSIEAALMQLFIPDLRASGSINVDTTLRGTMNNPRLTGSAEFQDAQLKFAGFPQLIDQVTGTLLFRGDRVDIDSLRATIGGGTVVAGGFITVAGLEPKRARISLQGTDVAIRYYEGLTVQGNFDLLLSGDIERVLLQGVDDVDITRTLLFRDIDFSTAILNVVLSRRGVTPIVAATWQDRVALRMHVVAPNTLAVKNNIADVTGSADLDVTGTLANPVILGTVTLNEGGRVRFQNIDYRLARGTINFQNPFRIDPYFDVTVEGRVSGAFSEIESGPIDVTVNLTGTLDRFTPTITSDPPTSDITLFSLLGFGTLGSKTGTKQGPDVALFGQSLLQQSLFGLLGSRVLPFADSFTYDPGLLDTSSDPGPKVTFEKRISNDLRVLVIYNLRDQRNRALVEWQVNPEWTLQFLRDEIRKEWRTEARFHRRYAAHWTFAGNRSPVTLFATTGPVAGTVQQSGPTTAPPAISADQTPIVRIDYRADAEFDTSILAQYIALKVGQPVTVRAVQASIKNLFATGDFRDIRVESEAAPGGMIMTFILSINYHLGEIRFDGLRGADRDRAQHELSVHVGDILSLDAVDRSATAVQQFLNRIGFLEAVVDPETKFFRPHSRAEVTFHIEIGPRATIGHVAIEGNLAPFTPDQLTRALRRGPGKAFRVLDARGDAERMKTFLVRRDYRKADVRYLGSTYDGATKRVALRYSAVAGPIVRVEVIGVPRNDVRHILPFRRNQAYSEDLVDAAADNIVRLYQRHGYFNAVADSEGRLEGNTWTTTFNVRPGQRYRLAAVTFSGSEKVSDQKLKGIVQTVPQREFRFFFTSLFRRPTGVTREALSADRDAIESYYRLKGFSEARVAAPVVNTSPNGTMTVDFPIVEGPQTIVSEVKLEGNEQVSANDLPKPQLRPGDPLNPQVLRTDLVSLQTFYAERGNAEVQIAPRPEIRPDKTTAKITYVIAEGPKIKVDDVVVRGNTYTKTNVILRKSDLDKGEPFSYTSILEAQRNLYRLGIFQRTEVQPEQAGTSVSDRNVTIQVEEGKDLTVAGSVGATKQINIPLSPLGSFSVAHRNLFGTARYLGLELIKSRERNEAFLTFREPFIFNFDIPLQLTIFQSDEKRRGAHLVQRGSFLEASKVTRYQTRWAARYEYKIGDCVINPKDPNDLCSQAARAIIPADRTVTNVRISSVTPTFFWDKRDDAIDPHRGFFTSASIEYAFPIVSAHAKFLKEFAQVTYYFPLTERTVFVTSGRTGLIQPLGHTVPFSERFTAGGESSHRAFPLDLLGTLCDPREDGCKETLVRIKGAIFPLGGNALFLTNLEYRFPIISRVGGAVFVDIGNVYHDSMIDLDDLRYGAGTGIRYLSPVGPLRIDIGYKLHRRTYEKPFAYFITLGYAF